MFCRVEDFAVGITSQTHVVEQSEDDSRIITDLLTDSLSAIDLLKGQNVRRRSRHIEIRVEWMRHKMNSGQVRLEWIPGSQNPADLFTTNVNTALLNLHRSRLGFVTVKNSPLEKLFELSVQRGRIEIWTQSRIAMLEVCCSAKTCAVVHRWREDGCWVHVHLSTPCSAGST